MIERLSTIITTVKETVFGHAALRYSSYLLILLALLLFWLYSGETEVDFVYNVF